MTEKELQMPGKLGLLSILRGQEGEIERLTEESRKLQRQMETLLISMSRVNAKPRAAGERAAAEEELCREQDLEITRLQGENQLLKRRLEELLSSPAGAADLSQSAETTAAAGRETAPKAAKKVKPRRVYR